MQDKASEPTKHCCLPSLFRITLLLRPERLQFCILVCLVSIAFRVFFKLCNALPLDLSPLFLCSPKGLKACVHGLYVYVCVCICKCLCAFEVVCRPLSLSLSRPLDLSLSTSRPLSLSTSLDLSLSLSTSLVCVCLGNQGNARSRDVSCASSYTHQNTTSKRPGSYRMCRPLGAGCP